MTALLHYGSLAKRIVGIVARTPFRLGSASKSEPLLSSFPLNPGILIVNTTRSFRPGTGRQNCVPEKLDKQQSDSQSEHSEQNWQSRGEFQQICPTLVTEVQAFIESQIFAKRVVVLNTFSEILASDDITPLKENGLMDEKTYWEIKANHDRMSPVQRRKFNITYEQIWPKWILNTRIIQDNQTGEKAVEIFIIFRVQG